MVCSIRFLSICLLLYEYNDTMEELVYPKVSFIGDVIFSPILVKALLLIKQFPPSPA